MKPTDIHKKFDCLEYRIARPKNGGIHKSYLYEDCVIGYYKTWLFILIVIQPKRNYYVQIYHRYTPFWTWPKGRVLAFGSDLRAADIIENKGKIVNQQKWNRFLCHLAAEAI